MFVKTFASLRLANIAVHHTLSNAQLMSKDIKQSSIIYFSGEVSTKEVSSHSAFGGFKTVLLLVEEVWGYQMVYQSDHC